MIPQLSFDLKAQRVNIIGGDGQHIALPISMISSHCIPVFKLVIVKFSTPPHSIAGGVRDRVVGPRLKA